MDRLAAFFCWEMKFFVMCVDVATSPRPHCLRRMEQKKMQLIAESNN
jgi:hypothetical protein